SLAAAAAGGAPNVLDTLVPADASSAPAESSVAPAADGVSTDPGLAGPLLATPSSQRAAPSSHLRMRAARRRTRAAPPSKRRAQRTTGRGWQHPLLLFD